MFTKYKYLAIVGFIIENTVGKIMLLKCRGRFNILLEFFDGINKGINSIIESIFEKNVTFMCIVYG